MCVQMYEFNLTTYCQCSKMQVPCLVFDDYFCLVRCSARQNSCTRKHLHKTRTERVRCTARRQSCTRKNLQEARKECIRYRSRPMLRLKTHFVMQIIWSTTTAIAVVGNQLFLPVSVSPKFNDCCHGLDIDHQVAPRNGVGKSHL